MIPFRRILFPVDSAAADDDDAVGSFLPGLLGHGVCYPANSIRT